MLFRSRVWIGSLEITELVKRQLAKEISSAVAAQFSAPSSPLGAIYSTNITPDNETGIGSWSDADLIKAMHEGVSKDGHRLFPAFPYTAFTKVSADIHNILGQLNKLDHETDMTVNNLANRLDAQEIKAMSHGDAARLFKLEEAVQELRYQVERGDEEMLDEDSVREMIDDHNMDKMHFEDADDFRGTVRQALMEILKGGEE